MKPATSRYPLTVSIGSGEIMDAVDKARSRLIEPSDWYDADVEKLQDLAAKIKKAKDRAANYDEAIEVRKRHTIESKVAAGITFVGPGRCGKDTASRIFAELTGLMFACATSEIIGESFASECGTSLEDQMIIRHQNRDAWRAKGDAMRADDPAALVRAVRAKGGRILNGVRSRVEMLAAMRENLTGLTVWIQRDSVEADPTLEFGDEVADEIIGNNGSVDDLRNQLALLRDAYGFPIAN